MEYTVVKKGVRKINMEPSWEEIANIAILLIEKGEGEKGKEEGRKVVRDMGIRLDTIRATQEVSKQTMSHALTDIDYLLKEGFDTSADDCDMDGIKETIEELREQLRE